MNKYEEKRLLIWGKTYPEKSKKYLECVCTGAVDEEGQFIRIYPIPFRYLNPEIQFHKYQWIRARVCKSTKDTRPESYEIDPASIKIEGEVLSTQNFWHSRQQWIFKNLNWQFRTYCNGLDNVQKNHRTSIAVIKPREVLNVEIYRRPEADRDRYFDKEQRVNSSLLQTDLWYEFNKLSDEDQRAVKNLQYIQSRIRVHWLCHDPHCKKHLMQIIDWEVVELQRKRGDEIARQKVIDITTLDKYDTHFFLGNLHQHPNRFMIVGLWYPKHPPSQPKQLLLDL
ncbi:MAG: hypothetical protein IT211_11995 [Armatimonadetes bacterium]|nr:hypothetical protein [Armatimonadota bacterium]